MDSNNYHVDYLQVTQHWSEESEAYAGGDGLVTLLSEGWALTRKVREEDVYFGGNRHTSLYYLEIEKDGETRVIPVAHNPYINRIIKAQLKELQKAATSD